MDESGSGPRFLAVNIFMLRKQVLKLPVLLYPILNVLSYF